MADPYSSFLLDTDFSESGGQPTLATNPVAPKTASNILSEFLQDKETTDVLAVAANRNNKLAQEGFGKDLLELNYGQLAAKYGKEVADNRHKIQKSFTDVNDAYNARRDTAQLIGDSALSVGSGLSSTVQGIASLGLLGLDKVDKFTVDADLGFDDAAIAVAESAQSDSEFIKGFQSQELADRQRLQAIESELDEADREQRYGPESEADFITNLRRSGEEFLDAGERILSDSAITGDIVSEALGSLLPSAKLASAASRLALAGTSKVTANKAVEKIAQTLAVAGSVGLTEASGTYQQTVTAVMSLTHDELNQTSQIYKDLLETGLSSEEAKEQLALSTGGEAFRRQLPMAAALGLIVGRFESAPISAFKGKGLIEGLRTIGLQTLEEGAQEGTGQLNQNLATRSQVDENASLYSGIGEGVATGAIGGTGISSTLAVPGLIQGTAKATIKGLNNIPASDILSKAAQGTANLTGNTLDTISRISAKAEPYVAPVIEKAKPIVRRGAEVITDLAEPLTSRIQDIADNTNNEDQAKTILASKSVEVLIDGLESKDTVIDLLNPIDSNTVPANFKDTVPENPTVIQSVTGILSTLAKPETNISRLDDTSILYAADKLNKLQGVFDILPGPIKNEVSKILSSSQVARIQNKAKKIDLNKNYTEQTPVNPTTTSDTINVAKINPTNVNPDFITKLLNHSDRKDISNEDIRLLEAASKIAKAVNDHTDSQVEISKELNVALSKKPAYKGREKDLPEVLDINNVSRSIQVSGFTDAKGNSLRSVNDYAADIFAGAQSKDGKFVNDKGYSTSVKTVAKQFGMFVTHLSNKVNALNTSFNLNDNLGKGRPVTFDSLVGGRKILPAGSPGSAKPVTYHKSSPKSVEFAQKVHADAVVAAEIYNTLVDTFPNIVVGPKIQINDLKKITEEIVTEPVQEPTQEVVQEEQTKIIPESTSIKVEDLAAYIQENIAQTNDINEFNDALKKDYNDLQNEIDILRKDDEQNDFEGKSDGYILGFMITSKANEDLGGYIGQMVIEAINRVGKITPKKVTEIIEYAKSAPLSTDTVRETEPVSVIEEEQITDDGELLDVRDDISDIIEDTVIEPTPITEEDVTETLQEVTEQLSVSDDYTNLPEIFHNTLLSKDREIEYSDADTLIGLIEAQEGYSKPYVAFAKSVLKPLSNAVNKRLRTVKRSKKDPRTIAEIMAAGEDLTSIRDYKNLMFVDGNTNQYNSKLLGLATLAAIDWLTTARVPDPSQLTDNLNDLGLEFSDVTQEQLSDIMNGVPVRQAAETLGRLILDIWNLRPNIDAPMVDIRAVEGLAKEILTTLDNNSEIINIKKIPTKVNGRLVQAETIIIKPVVEFQKQLGISGQGVIQKIISPESIKLPSINKKIPNVDETQNRGDVPLSNLERTALKNMQDTPHYMSETSVNFIEALGFQSLARILGYTDLGAFKGNDTLRRSVEGRNLSIEYSYNDAFRVIEGIREVSDEAPGTIPVHYPVSISKVGRHQAQGINPQNSKILRALVTPTHSTLDMTTKEHRDAFWLTVAQAGDLRKVENENHQDILKTIEQDFNSKYGEAVAHVLSWLETGDLDITGFQTTMGIGHEMAQVSAVIAVAELEFAKKNNKEAGFKTTLSFELDGKTDGPANMMSNFGQGLVSLQDLENFKRVGYFLGRTDLALNSYFSDGNFDLYEVTSRQAEKDLNKKLLESGTEDKLKITALQRFAAAFGDFKMQEDGTINMTRNSAKNPMTKTVYGSGVIGVGEGIAQDMLLGFYAAMLDIPEGTDIEAYLGYPKLAEDINTLFGVDITKGIDPTTFEFHSANVSEFSESVTDIIGKSLSSSAKYIIGDPITKVNDILVFITGLQSEVLKNLFDQRLEQLIEKRKAEGKIKSRLELSQRDYNNLVDELSVYAPLYSNEHQSLAVGSFAYKPSTDMELSANMDGRLRQKSTLKRPDDSGVKVIPYLTIGRGDAMMMNRIYADSSHPTDTLPVFDGIDMPVDKVSKYASQINRAVMENWDADVLSDIVADFESFIRHIGVNNPILKEAFTKLQKKNKKSRAKPSSINDLINLVREAQKANLARKRAFRKIPIAVDHMGGSGTAHIRGETTVTPMSLSEINNAIQEELVSLNVVEEIPVKESYTELTVYDAQGLINGLLRETKNTSINQTVRAVRNKLPKGLKVVTGSLKQLNTYRDENYPEDGLMVTGAGSMDIKNNVIFIPKKGNETLAHELVHAGTMQQVINHYEGNTNPAVSRLETLMNEFMGLDFSTSSKQVNEAVNAAKQAILEYQVNSDTFSKAGALNEFMAWTLTNEQIAKTLKTTRTKTVLELSRKTLALIRKLMGFVPNDMFSNILFNTKLLNRVEIEDTSNVDIGNQDNNNNGNNNNNNNNGNDGGNDNGEVTPPARKYTNFWINEVRKMLDAIPNSNTPLSDTKRLRQYTDTASDIVTQLEFGGFSLSEYQKQTFKAIHVVIATEMKLDPVSLIAMNRVFEYVTDNLAPEMFKSSNQQQLYATVIGLFGSTKNKEGVSDAIAVLLALSQTSKMFRDALDNIPEPESHKINRGSLNEFLSSSTGFLMRKLVGSIDVSGENINTTLDNLSETIIRQDSDKEYAILRNLMSAINKADKFTAGAINSLAERTFTVNERIQAGNRSRLTKTVANTVTFASSFLEEKRSNIALEGAKRVTHMGQLLDNFVPVREFITEIIGTDKTNADVIALLDRTNYDVQSVRQAYREDVPVLFQDMFSVSPNENQWRILHNVLGKGDFSSIFDIKKPNESMRTISQSGFLARKIAEKEAAINKNYSPDVANDIIDKVVQLANYINGHGAGHLLLRNAYAINKVTGEFNKNMTQDIDQLISYYVLQGTEQESKDITMEMYNTDPEAVKAIITYMQALNREEDSKGISEAARLNGYKGHIPNHGAKSHTLVIEEDRKESDLKKMGFTRVADYPAEDNFSTIKKGYYFTTVKQGGTYSQGVLQTVHASYRGVDATTGLSVNEVTSGIIDGQNADRVTKEMNRITSVPDSKEALIPVFDDEGKVLYYERAINPDLAKKYLMPKSNIALMLGAWAGRQVEEKFAQRYNNELIDRLKTTYDNRGGTDDNLFINLSDKKLKDEVYKETWRIIPPQTKAYIEEIFGEEGFYVRKDMINLSLGYREPSILDVWTGKTRLPEAVQTMVRAMSNAVIGPTGFNTISVLSKTEEGLQNLVSNAKDLIVVRSLIVPYMNIQANAFQLFTRGVSVKDTIRGAKTKLAEIEVYNTNINKLIELDIRLNLAAGNPNQLRILNNQIQVIQDENARMTIAPVIAAGAYKNISEGITDLDVEITSGRISQWIEGQVNRLPNKARTIVKYGLLSKDTAIYKGANKAVQYGDFIAKSILYDHYINNEKLKPEEAINRINEEFVNYSVPAGRTRSYLESLGGTWFLAFKIRIMKTALRMLRDNPLRALIVASTVGDLGSPVEDNLVTVTAQDRLDYSLGWDMLFGAPELNPWINMTQWATE